MLPAVLFGCPCCDNQDSCEAGSYSDCACPDNVTGVKECFFNGIATRTNIAI